jgi:hypothetical protein
VAILTKFFGRTVGEGAGVAIGTATAKGIEPPLTQFANAMRETFPFLPLDPQVAAALRAREARPDYGGIDLQGVDPSREAAYSGMRPKRFDALTELMRDHPSLGELIRLRRRRLALGPGHGISQDEFREWMRRAGFTTKVIDALTRLLVEYLAPADVANAVQQGFMPNDDILPEPALHGGPYTVPSEESNLDAAGEAGVSGLDKDRLRILAQLSGNPPGPMELLELWRREFITEGDVERGIREGRTKTKWIPALKKMFWQLLPPSVLVNLRLRGYIEDPEFRARMRLHGFTGDQANDWFLSSGRPLAPQQMLDLIARKGPGPDGGVFGWADFDKGMVESDIKPKYAQPAHALYYKYPPLFQLRRAVESGAITPARARAIMHIERYEPDDINGLIASWTSDGTGEQAGLTKAEIVREYESRLVDEAVAAGLLRELGMSDAAIVAELELADYRVVRSSLTAAQTKTRTLYVGWRIDRVAASNELDSLGIPASARELALATWDHERELNRPDLTPAQIATAAQRGIWTAQQSYDELLSRGYSDRDARVLLRLHKVTGP